MLAVPSAGEQNQSAKEPRFSDKRLRGEVSTLTFDSWELLLVPTFDADIH